LHTCSCIVFECLNSNLCLNSFVWLLLKLENPSFLLFLFCCAAHFPKSGCAPWFPGRAPASPPSARRGPVRFRPIAPQPAGLSVRARPNRARRRPQWLTCRTRTSSPLPCRTEPESGSPRRPCRARPIPRARTPRWPTLGPINAAAPPAAPPSPQP
jgi:hypothetical protein